MLLLFMILEAKTSKTFESNFNLQHSRINNFSKIEPPFIPSSEISTLLTPDPLIPRYPKDSFSSFKQDSKNYKQCDSSNCHSFKDGFEPPVYKKL